MSSAIRLPSHGDNFISTSDSAKDAPSTQHQGHPRQLQYLATHRSLQALFQPPTDTTNTSIHPTLTNHKSIHTALKNTQSKLNDIPSADRHVHLGPEGRLSGEAYTRAEHFRSIWRYSPPSEHDRHESRDSAFWLAREGKRCLHNSFDLVRYPDSDGVVFEPMSEHRPVVRDGMEHMPDGLDRLISSQLMLYRLLVTFGGLPQGQRLDGYKRFWEVTLVLREEADVEEDTSSDAVGWVNVLGIYEHKGWVCASFRGTQEGKKKAEGLIDYLIGEKCAHSYDNVLAGRSA